MSKKLIISLLLYVTFISLMGVGIAVGSDITGAHFSGIIRTTNNSTAAVNVASNVSGINTTNFINAGWLNSSANNCAIRSATGTDLPFMPGYSANPWMIFLPSLGNNSITDSVFYTKSATGGDINYFPGAAGMSVPDTMTEPDNNFSCTLNGTFVNSTANGTAGILVDHSDTTNGGYQLIKSPTVSGNLTSRIITVTAATVDILPNATGNYTNITTANPAVAHYLNVDDPVATPDDAATYVSTLSAALQKDAYNVQSPSYLGSGQIITSVKVYFRCIEAGGVGKAQPGLRLAGSETMGTEIDVTGAWATYSETIARPGGGSWTLADIADLQVIIGLRNTTGVDDVLCTQVYVQVAYTYETYHDASATSIASGEYDIEPSFITNLINNSSFEGAITGWSVEAGGALGYTTTQKYYGSYSGNFTRTGVNSSVYQNYTGYAGGITYTYGIRVKSSLAGDVFIRMYDGVGITSGTYHTGGGDWEWLTVTRTLDAAANRCWCMVQVNINGTIYVDGGILIVGSSLPNQYYNHNLAIDGVIVGYAAHDGGLTVPNSTSVWTFCEGDTVYYVESIGYEQGGVSVSAWEWEYDTTFYDLIGANDGTPSFRTTTTDADVSSMLFSFGPITQPTAPAFAVGAGPDFWDTSNVSTGNFTGATTNATVLDYPFKDVIDAVANAGGVPYQIPSTFISSFILIVISLLTSLFLKRYSAQSIFFKSIVNIVMYGILVALHIYDWWMFIFFMIFEVSIWFGAQHRRE